MPVVGTLDFTPETGPVLLWVTFADDGGASVTVPAPVMCLEGNRGGVPCANHPATVQSAVDKLARLSVSPAAAGELFRIVVSAAKTIAQLTVDDASFVWPAVVLKRNTGSTEGDVVAGSQ